MAVSRKISTKKLDRDNPVPTVSEKPAATTTTPGPAKKKAVGKKSAAATKQRVAGKKASPVAKKKSTGKKVAGSRTRTAVASGKGAKPVLSRRQRQQMIGDGAYLISLKRDPWQSNPDIDWIAAETVIDMIFDVTD